MAESAGTGTVRGTVEHINEWGLKLEGHEGWANLSRFAEPAPDLSQVAPGQVVELALDARGYVRELTALEDAPVANGSSVATSDDEYDDDAPAPTPPSKDTRITRLACLKAAVELAVAHEAPEPDTVLGFAEQFEAWTTRTA